MVGKKAGLLIGGIVIVLAIILLVVRGAVIKKKDAQLEEQMMQEAYVQQEQQNNVGVNPQNQGMVTWGNNQGGDAADNNIGVGANVLEEANEKQNSDSSVGVESNSDSSVGAESSSETPKEDLPATTDLNTNLSLELVDKVEVLGTYEANVLVSAKSVYKVGNSSYAYALSMIIPIEGKGYQLIDYLCSVSTWNSVSAGDSIVVTYGLDENGIVVVKGLSK